VEDGIKGEISKSVYKLFTSFTYTIYRVRLQTECFPKRWKKGKIISVIKPSKEKVRDESKY